ncbi:hypothetical protein D3C81_1776090 [compost metagenome]
MPIWEAKSPLVIFKRISSFPSDSSSRAFANRCVTVLKLIVSIRFSAFSSRRLNSSSTLKAMDGYFAISSFSFSPWITHIVDVSSAWALSVKGNELNKESSPLNSPGPSTRITCSLPFVLSLDIFTLPLYKTNSVPPWSPAIYTISCFSKVCDEAI